MNYLSAKDLALKLKSDIGFFISFFLEYYQEEMTKKLNQKGFKIESKEDVFETVKELFENKEGALIAHVFNFPFDLDKIPEEYREVIKEIK